MPEWTCTEVLLEVDAWTGHLGEFTPTAETGSRMEDLATSMAAVLVAEGMCGSSRCGGVPGPGAGPAPASAVCRVTRV